MPLTRDQLSILEKFVKDASTTYKNDLVSMLLHYGLFTAWSSTLLDTDQRIPLESLRFIGRLYTGETLRYLSEITALIHKATEFLPLVKNAMQEQALSEFFLPENLDVSECEELATPFTLFKYLKRDELVPNIIECVVNVLTDLTNFRLTIGDFLDSFPKESLLIYFDSIQQLLKIEGDYLDFLKSAKVETLSKILHYMEDLGIVVELNSTILPHLPANYLKLTNTSTQYIATKAKQVNFSNIIAELNSPDSYLLRHIRLVSQFIRFHKRVVMPDESWQKQVMAYILEAQESNVPLVKLEIITKSLVFIGRSVQFLEDEKPLQTKEGCAAKLSFIFNLLEQLDNEAFHKTIAEQWQLRRNTLNLLPPSHQCYANSISQINELYIALGNLDILISAADYQKYIFKLLDHQTSLIKSYQKIFSKTTMNVLAFPIGNKNIYPFHSSEFYHKSKILKVVPLQSILEVIRKIRRELPSPSTTNSTQSFITPYIFNNILVLHYRNFGDNFMDTFKPGYLVPDFGKTVINMDDDDKAKVTGPLKQAIEKINAKKESDLKAPLAKVKPFNEKDFPAAPPKKLESKQLKKNNKFIKKSPAIRADKNSKSAKPTAASCSKVLPEIAEMQQSIDKFKEYHADHEQVVAVINQHMKHRDPYVKIDACLKLIDVNTMQFNRLIGKRRNSLKLKKFLKNYDAIEQIINEISKDLLKFIALIACVPKERAAEYQHRLKINDEDHQETQNLFSHGLDLIELASQRDTERRDKIKAIMGEEWWETHLDYQDEEGNWHKDDISQAAKNRQLLENVLKSTKELHSTFQRSKQVLEEIQEAKQPASPRASFTDRAYPSRRRYSDSDIKPWSVIHALHFNFLGKESQLAKIDPIKDHGNPRAITADTLKLAQRSRTSYYVHTLGSEVATAIPAPLQPLPKNSTHNKSLLSKLQELIPCGTWQMIRVSSETTHYGFIVKDQSHVATLQKILDDSSSPITMEVIERNSQQIAILSHVSMKNLQELGHVARDELLALTHVEVENLSDRPMF